MVKTAIVQTEIALKEPKRNLEKIIKYSEEIDAELIVFPECSNSGYLYHNQHQAIEFAETVPGPITNNLSAISKEQKKYIAIGLLERVNSTLRNTAILFRPDGKMNVYRKTHIPFLGVDRFVLPGQEIIPFNTDIGCIGILICYDWRFPEAARCLALQGADVIIGLSAWPEGAAIIPKLLISARAAENRVWVISSNRVGKEEDITYIGKSSIVDPAGDTIASLNNEEGFAVGNVDFSKSRKKRIVRIEKEYEIDLFNDRRPMLYESIVQEKRHA